MKVTSEQYALLCDVVERAWQYWPVGADEPVEAVDEGFWHTSDYAREAANRILQALGLELEAGTVEQQVVRHR